MATDRESRYAELDGVLEDSRIGPIRCVAVAARVVRVDPSGNARVVDGCRRSPPHRGEADVSGPIHDAGRHGQTDALRTRGRAGQRGARSRRNPACTAQCMDIPGGWRWMGVPRGGVRHCNVLQHQRPTKPKVPFPPANKATGASEAMQSNAERSKTKRTTAQRSAQATQAKATKAKANKAK